MTSPADLPPVIPASRPALNPIEALYLRALMHWYRFKRKPPSLGQLAELLRRSGRPSEGGRGRRPGCHWPSRRSVYRGLLALETKGYTKRNDQGKFEVIK